MNLVRKGKTSSVKYLALRISGSNLTVCVGLHVPPNLVSQYRFPTVSTLCQDILRKPEKSKSYLWK